MALAQKSLQYFRWQTGFLQQTADDAGWSRNWALEVAGKQRDLFLALVRTRPEPSRARV